MRSFVFIIFFSLVLLGGCAKKPPVITEIFVDDFDRAELGENWKFSGGRYELKNGKLRTTTASNAPLWLNRRLPQDVKIEFDATPLSEDIDVKCEIFGDGKNHASGYILILGGWRNKLSVIARLDEHGKDRRRKKAGEHKQSVTYHWEIIRKGNLIEWFIDGKKYMEFHDSEPLSGDRHNRFAFNNWQSETLFDNLKITPFTK